MNQTQELTTIIIAIVVVAGIATLYFSGNAMKSTGSDMVNNTQNSTILAWAGVPLGSFLMDTGTSWVKTAESMTLFILAIFFVGGLIWYYLNK